MTRIAFFGLGAMGLGMAANLARAGHDVTAFDVSAVALERAEAAGCRIVTTAAQAVSGTDAVITMLPAGPGVRSVYARDLLPHASPNSLLIDCSTIDIDSARAVADSARSAGFRAVDAPVSGGVSGADAGTLAFMVGCQECDFPEVEALLAPMARAVVRAGEAGAGQAAKICNNMLLGISMLGVCEAFGLAEKLGLDPQAFFDIASKSSGQCWSLTNYSPWPGQVETAPSNRDYDGGFLVRLMLKDLKLSQEAASRSGAVTPMGAEAAALFGLFDSLGYGGKDFSSIMQLVRGRLDLMK